MSIDQLSREPNIEPTHCLVETRKTLTADIIFFYMRWHSGNFVNKCLAL